MPTLGFVGLGAMGGRMAKRLLDAAYPVVGYNRTPARARWLVDAGMRAAASPRAVADAADVVFSMVTDTDALHAVARGPDGILAGLRPGAVYVEMSTVHPATIRALGAEVVSRGAVMLDAPVSGSVATLEAGQLAFMVGGDPAVLERVRPYLLAIGPTITHVGPLGLAMTMKVATNLGLAVQMLAFSEAVLLAEKAGIARERAVEALLRSVIASPMVRYRGPFVLSMPAEAWFDVGMMQKDLRLALDIGRAVGAVLPATALTHEWLAAAQGRGLGEFDFAVVFDVLAELSGLPPSKKSGGA
ncbi:MAG TPA: NAD(P)-dependent oxidoreductase [Methylomirabilota bacterium]|jgi:3-hydroxyisobutyrate dehydrogenase-like beta-hydroxyacid dehydrogenase|nr:NAD(P)-dependent oxidoreductase [Methylomirabilota bacterium]